MRLCSLFFISLLLSVILCFDASAAKQSKDNDSFELKVNQSLYLFKTKAKNLKGIALVIHGLNLNPLRMRPIIDNLLNAGIDVLSLSLYGHGANYSSLDQQQSQKELIESFKNVSYELWRDETYQAYQYIKRRSAQENTPLFFIGYSIGGLMGCDLFVSYTDVKFDRMVLFAPALKINKLSYIFKALSLFPNLMIPSLSPEFYRANSATSIAAYNALYSGVEHFETHISKKLNIPTIVFIDKDDELVSYQSIEDMTYENQLDKWKIHTVQKGKDVINNYHHHLIIDKQSMGQDPWQRMMMLTTEHLSTVKTAIPK